MSKITIHNYEAFMLDYLEGNLSPQDTLALQAFAILHPELDLNFDEELVALENENISFNAKQNLKINSDDALVIGYLENTLEGKEKQLANNLAKNNLVFKKELGLYKKTIATPDTSILFENKALLKREPKIIVFTQSFSFRMAAAIILLAGIWLLISKVLVNDRAIVPQLADKTISSEPIIKKEKTKAEEDKINSEKALAHTPTKNKRHVPKTQHKKTNNSPVNFVIKEELPVEVAVITDTLPEQTNKPYLDTNAMLLANTSVKDKASNTYIIEEGIDDELYANNYQPKKNKVFNFASKVFKKMHQGGIAKVNGSDNDNTLFIGSVTISK